MLFRSGKVRDGQVQRAIQERESSRNALMVRGTRRGATCRFETYSYNLGAAGA